jgi:hypothetical protein
MLPLPTLGGEGWGEGGRQETLPYLRNHVLSDPLSQNLP